MRPPLIGVAPICPCGHWPTPIFFIFAFPSIHIHILYICLIAYSHSRRLCLHSGTSHTIFLRFGSRNAPLLVHWAYVSCGARSYIHTLCLHIYPYYIDLYIDHLNCTFVLIYTPGPLFPYDLMSTSGGSKISSLLNQ